MLRLRIAIVSLLTLASAACGGSSESETQVATTVTTLVSVDTREGTGAEAMFGNEVVVHYTGWIYDAKRNQHRGREFDNSRNRNDPLAFRVGNGEVIKGWDEGVIGMKVGGKRLLTIPPSMAYGREGLGELIPPDSTLLFDVELIEVK